MALVACAPPIDDVPVDQPPVRQASPYTDSFVQVARYTRGGFRGPEFVEILDVEITGDLVLVCAATQGFLVVDRHADDLPVIATISPQAGSPRCQHVAVDGDIALITNRGDEFAPTPHVTAFDLSDPSAPVEIASITSSDLSFEGIVAIGGGHFAVALRGEGIGIISAADDAVVTQNLTLTRIADLATDAWDFAMDPSRNMLVVADGQDGVRALRVVPRTEPPTLTPIWHAPVEGVVQHVEIGDVVFASAGTPGVVVLTMEGEPMITIDTPGSALMSAFANEHLYVADWTEARVYDVANLDAPRLVAAENIAVNAFSRVLALDAIDDTAYIGEWTGLFEYRRDPWVPAPDIAIDDYGLVFPAADVGGESARALVVTNTGDAPLKVFGFDVDEHFALLDDELTIAPGESEALELRFRPTFESPTESWITLWSDDPDELELSLFAEGNAYGIGVGDPIPDFDWRDLQTGENLRMRDLRGSVVVLAYFATF